jgi:hypothetical protein
MPSTSKAQNTLAAEKSVNKHKHKHPVNANSANVLMSEPYGVAGVVVTKR